MEGRLVVGVVRLTKASREFWRERAGVWAGPAIAFFKGPGTTPRVHRFDKLGGNNAWRRLFESNLWQTVPELTSDSAAALGCTDRTGAKSPPTCAVLIGRHGEPLLAARAMFAGLIENLTRWADAPEHADLAKALKAGQIRLLWMNAASQPQFCAYHLASLGKELADSACRGSLLTGLGSYVGQGSSNDSVHLFAAHWHLNRLRRRHGVAVYPGGDVSRLHTPEQIVDLLFWLSRCATEPDSMLEKRDAEPPALNPRADPRPSDLRGWILWLRSIIVRILMVVTPWKEDQMVEVLWQAGTAVLFLLLIHSVMAPSNGEHRVGGYLRTALIWMAPILLPILFFFVAPDVGQW
eukprot:evm.model.scf_2233EXC.2 EVM.evm.TU.scf_2233EXC.2   scf_2233EXC:6601-7653(-)